MKLNRRHVFTQRNFIVLSGIFEYGFLIPEQEKLYEEELKI